MGAESGLTRLELGDDLGYEVVIAAASSVVFRHWTDPDLLVHWMGKVATLDPRPGGGYRLEYGNGDVASGTFVEVDPPSRLTSTWGWEGGDAFPPGATTIHVSLEAAPTGGTRLRLRHTGIPAEFRSNVDAGWGYFLPRLVSAATGLLGDGVP